MPTSTPDARVVGVTGNIVSVESDAPMTKNSIVYVRTGEARLEGEILRVTGRRADAQMFEETQGVRVGDPVELTGRMLSATLGPGLLGTVYDGLQKPLRALAERDGFFLARGRSVDALDATRRWTFVPSREPGARLRAGDVVGTVAEHRFTHKIMVPFGEPGEVELLSIPGGELGVDDPVARIRDAAGRVRELTMAQRWPVRRPVPERLLRRRLCERRFPEEPLSTTIRLIDTFFPIALGGTACIPGPFGAGKTVLQGLIARFSTADVVVQVACGERAGEVLETIEEFGSMKDPRGGRLMDRTVVICNTSSMPVAAREASIYMGITIGEYYRQQGLNVLLIADSTSRWAQAMRETSGRLEEIPGEEGFPAYLDSAIKGIYERAGVLRTNDGAIGSLTIIGTVSPAGGNFDEPVTQSTLGTVKSFLGLSAARAYKRFYPAVDPLISWSRYLDQLRPWFDTRLRPGWTESVAALSELLQRGDAIYQMMQVTGEEGVTLDDYVTHQKALLLDMVYLQQDAFDKVDASTPQARQKEAFELVWSLVQRDYAFKDKEESRRFFTQLTGLLKNLNYAAAGSPEYASYRAQIDELVKTLGRAPAPAPVAGAPAAGAALGA
ncbi:V-type ATP synthase subunit A [Anaeromyxobacter oryzae]|uniref:V-type ATP synthase alpha chain n=1 Tax=Anaeromyxobacter oryzae TaxID=2918170 RepID=A0ABM7WPS4_9BACT|nr:V-type ATP synthase subunit A [Anaeromyxobacter oryzae]BDG01456.1 V-type ATP synthase alpha chain [Anaeromyxobacter oryzae]